MLKEVAVHQITWLILTCLTFLTLLLAYSSVIRRKRLVTEVQRKEDALESKPIEVIVQEFRDSIKETEQNIASGKLFNDKLQELIKLNNEQLKYIDVGLSPPVYKFDDSESLKAKISECLEQQFQVINKGDATAAYSNWEWFGSKSKGSQMVNAYQRLLLKAFNAEFDVIRKQMRHSTYDTASEKSYRLEEQLGMLGETANVSISHNYLNLKIRELSVWHSELERKENLKKEKKRQQTLLREQVKLSGGDTEEIEDDVYYRKSDLKKAQKLALQLHGASALDMEMKISRMKKEIAQLEAKFQRATSQAQLTKAGYIYVISNIGSFGEGIVKIGMTRRLEPMDRVIELGDASVPFRFDVHTLTFVENAPQIENTLHNKFSSRRVNTENNRKEFFKVSPKEVADAMAELGIVCDWYFDVEAKEYRESLLIRESFSKEIIHSSPLSNQLPASI